MTIQIDLPVEIENSLRARAAAAGQDVASYVRTMVTESLLQEPEVGSRKRPSAAEFAKRLEAWTALHPVLDHPIDDSRESIYSGRE